MKRVEKRSLSAVWLVLLTLAGLAIGSGVGYLLLKRLRSHPSGEGSGTVTAPVAPTEPHGAQLTPPEPEGNDRWPPRAGASPA